ncbi:MAG: sigma 54-interacting transcriptional regulator [Clostridiales Family XIII bacterium]|nr:sigma 54-interacting transcriptional regulator [Clostridiales Family XIII bacterium]
MKTEPQLTIEDYQFFLEHVNGFVAIDTAGRVTYINKQICDFCRLDHDTAIGKHITELFPFSKMMDTVNFNQSESKTEFYFYEGRFSASTRHPMYKNNKLIGVAEYDIFEDMALVEAFVNHYINLDEELKYFKEESQRLLGAKYTIDTILGRSYTIRNLKEKLRHVARGDSTILITGETGTGKELIAHAIHNLSKRRLRNFIRINAAGIPESLAESELFGYDPGAFTGASKGGKKGKFELADKGSLFIDEINQMPISIQSKLLRVLQEKELDRVGGSKNIPIDVRLIAATNQDLNNLVSKGYFRKDLYYRLNVVEIHVPPLRERREDIPLLIEHFVEQCNNIFGKQVKKIDEAALEILLDYDWPGNVRELQNVIEK